MIAAATAASTVASGQPWVIQWMLGLLSGASGVIAFLFWQLLRAKDGENKAYREVAPIATASLENARNLERLVQKIEQERGAGDSLVTELRKSIDRLDEAVRRLESVGRRQV